MEIRRATHQIGEMPRGHERVIGFSLGHLLTVKLLAHFVIVRRCMKRLLELLDRRIGGDLRQRA
jgi:hypothetical protein